MHLDTRVTIHIPRPPKEVFDFAVASENQSRMLHAFGPIPGVSSVALLDGVELLPGGRRRVAMTDGSTMIEEIIALAPPGAGPGRHEYRWMNAPAPPFSLLVRGGHAIWTFTPESGGTRVDWSYQFELTSPLAFPLAAPAVALFRRWMDRALRRLRSAQGDGSAPRPAP